MVLKGQIVLVYIKVIQAQLWSIVHSENSRVIGWMFMKFGKYVLTVFRLCKKKVFS